MAALLYRKQLEKAYTLCAPCERVLQNTFHQQNATILGNRIRQLQKKGLSVLDLDKTVNGEHKKSLFISLMKYCVVLFACLILLEIIVTADYSDSSLRKNLPPYLFYSAKKLINTAIRVLHYVNHIAVDFPITGKIMQYLEDSGRYLSQSFSNTIENITATKLFQKFIDIIPKNHLKSHPIHFLPNTVENGNYLIDITLTSFSGLFLQSIITVFANKKIFFEILRLISWISIVLSLWYPTQNGSLKSLLHLALAVFIIMSALKNDNPRAEKLSKKLKIKKRKKNMRRLNQNAIYSDFSDNEIFNKSDENRPGKNTASFTECDTTTTNCNKSFTYTANNSMSSSFNTNSTFLNTSNDLLQDRVNGDLNASLSNLNLSKARASPLAQNYFSKPVLTPPKLKTVTQSPWIAGGFWHNSFDCESPVPENSAGFSRSSSQSSGFVSQANERVNFYSLSPSPVNSVYGDADRNSVLSEPINSSFYEVRSRTKGKRLSSQSYFQRLPQKNVCYPVLTNQEMLYINAYGPLRWQSSGYFLNGEKIDREMMSFDRLSQNAQASEHIKNRRGFIHFDKNLIEGSDQFRDEPFKKGSLFKNYSRMNGSGDNHDFSCENSD